MAVRRLRMLTTGPDRNYSPGQILIIDAKQAIMLVDGGHAVYVDVLEASDAVSLLGNLKKGRR